MRYSELFLALLKDILERNGSGLGVLENARSSVEAALDDPARRNDMALQLLRLACSSPAYGRVDVTDGRLLYVSLRLDRNAVVFGTETFEAQEGFVANEPTVVGGRVCWIERGDRAQKPRMERVVHAGRLGKLYPFESIGELKECSGVPCYDVNYSHGGGNVGFVVLDETEGRHYESTDRLVVAGDEPAYIAYDAERRTAHHVLVIGTDEITNATHFGRPCVVDGIAYVARTGGGGPILPNQQIWSGRKRMLEAYRVYGLDVVRGQLAYAVVTESNGDTKVRVLGEERTFPDVDQWWTNRASDSPFVVFSGYDPTMGVYANFTRLCDGCVQPNGISLADDGVTLRVRLENETEPREFDLRKLGVLPAVESVPVT